MKTLWTKHLLGLVLFFSLGQLAHGAELNGRHIMIVHSGLDAVWGSALFMIKEGENAAASEIPVLLPRETDDFQIQEGLDPQDLVLDKTSGKIVIRKTFPPGEHFIAIGFKVPAQGGVAKMTFVPSQEVSELSILTKPGNLGLAGTGFTLALDTEMNGQRYDRLTRADVTAGTTLDVTLTGISEGRSRLWYLGGTLAVILLGLGTILAIKTKPNPATGAESIGMGIT